MCGKCANLENRLPWKRIQAIRATDRYRRSEEHRKDIERLEKLKPKREGK